MGGRDLNGVWLQFLLLIFSQRVGKPTETKVRLHIKCKETVFHPQRNILKKKITHSHKFLLFYEDDFIQLHLRLIIKKQQPFMLLIFSLNRNLDNYINVIFTDKSFMLLKILMCFRMKDWDNNLTYYAWRRDIVEKHKKIWHSSLFVPFCKNKKSYKQFGICCDLKDHKFYLELQYLHEQISNILIKGAPTNFIMA